MTRKPQQPIGDLVDEMLEQIDEAPPPGLAAPEGENQEDAPRVFPGTINIFTIEAPPLDAEGEADQALPDVAAVESTLAEGGRREWQQTRGTPVT
jgi:hypothetical protein